MFWVVGGTHERGSACSAKHPPLPSLETREQRTPDLKAGVKSDSSGSLGAPPTGSWMACLWGLGWVWVGFGRVWAGFGLGLVGLVCQLFKRLRGLRAAEGQHASGCSLFSHHSAIAEAPRLLLLQTVNLGPSTPHTHKHTHTQTHTHTPSPVVGFDRICRQLGRVWQVEGDLTELIWGGGGSSSTAGRGVSEVPATHGSMRRSSLGWTRPKLAPLKHTSTQTHTHTHTHSTTPQRPQFQTQHTHTSPPVPAGPAGN
jgi:hypothetical protein